MKAVSKQSDDMQTARMFTTGVAAGYPQRPSP